MLGACEAASEPLGRTCRPFILCQSSATSQKVTPEITVNPCGGQQEVESVCFCVHVGARILCNSAAPI